MSVAYASFLDEITDGFEPGADLRSLARQTADRALDGTTEPAPAANVALSSEEEEVRQNQEALKGLGGMLAGLQAAGKKPRR